MNEKFYQSDIAIIGAGPVGLFSVFQVGMLGMKSIVIDSLPHIGGQCSALYPQKPIYDIPAHPSIMAEELIQSLNKQIQPFNPQFLLNQSVDSFERSDEYFHLLTSAGVKISVKAVIIAAGAGVFGHNKPPLINIGDFEGRSVFYAVQNIEIFHNKTISIIGGGDSAVDWALSLSNIAKKIYFIHRREKFKAAPESVNQLLNLVKCDKVELIIPYQLDSIYGENGFIREIRLLDLDGNFKSLYSDFLLPFFGLSTNLGPILSWGLDIKQRNVKVDHTTMSTNIKGVFGVGDIIDYPGKLKLILTGFAECAIAAHSAYKFIYPEKMIHFEHSTTKGVLQL